MEKIKATAGILSFNSARTLTRALKSVQAFDDILICDGGSTDGTKDIAAKFGARIIDQPQHGRISDFSAVRNHMLQNAKYEWFLYIDSDETASLELVEEIRAIVHADSKPFVYRVPQGFKYDDRDIAYYSSLPGYQHRFFSGRSVAKFVKPIHERIDFPDQEVGTLEGKWFIYWDEFEKSPAGNMEHLKRDAAWNVRQPFMSFLYWKVFRNLLGAFHIFLYVIWSRFFHRWSECAPIRAEWNKIVYKLKHVIYALKFRFID